MQDLIAAANGKLDDPLMLEWALDYYDSLPQNAQDIRARIEATWFHDLFIAKLIEQDETEMLPRLFYSLPARHFATLTALIVKRWPDWPADLASSAIGALAVNAPLELSGLFEACLLKSERGASLDIERFLGIRELAGIGTEGHPKPWLNRLSQRVLALPESDFGRMVFLPTILGMGGALPPDTFESVLEAALRGEKTEYRCRGILKALFQGLFGNAEYLELVFAREQNESEQRLETIAPFFTLDAPLAQIDQWLDSPPDFGIVVPMLEELSGQTSACAKILGILRNTAKFGELLSDAVQSQLAMAACIHGFARETFDELTLGLEATITLLSADLVASRGYRPLFEHLCAFDRQDIVDALNSRFPSVKYTYGGIQLANAMGGLGWSEFVPCLIESLREDRGDFLHEAASGALVEIGPPAQAALIEGWDGLDRSQQIFGLSVIGDVGGEDAADFALARFDALMNDDVELCCELVVSNPNQRLLDRLQPELRRKQPLIDRAYYIIARLFNRDDDATHAAKSRVLEDLMESANIRKALDSGDFTRKSLSLELRCPSCGAVNRYEAKGVIMPREQHKDVSYLIDDEFPCASCGQEVEFEFTAMAQMALTAELLLAKIARESGQRQDPRVTLLDCKLDGQTMPLAVGLKKLRDRVSNTPTDARAWFQLGNLLAYTNRPKATIQAYREAVRVEPNAIDAKFMLATVLRTNQANEEAFKILAEALNRSSDWQFLAPYPNFGQSFADIYNQLLRSLGRKDLPVLHPSSVAAPKKVSRNDPCPCGSGKKYKKCCGF